MAFIDNVRELSGKITKEQEDFLTKMRVEIEGVAKLGYKQAGFWPHGLARMARQAKNLDREPSVVEVFELFTHACQDLSKQGFKAESVITDNGSVMFCFKW
jgi:hypothetical protein